MKKDNLKDFVDRNRPSFDDASPGEDVLAKIQARLTSLPTGEKKAKVLSFRYGWAAAAVLVLAIGVLFFFREKETVNTPTAVAHTPGTQSLPVTARDTVARPASPLLVTSDRKKNKVHGLGKHVKGKNNRSRAVSQAEALALSQWQVRLGDSLSASDRLATVLEMGKQAHLSVADLKVLANTMNRDESSNVRLAALDVLAAQPDRKVVKKLILPSVARQEDPIVQMELLSMLTPDEARLVKTQLLEITQNPLNIDAVRDQAFVALLRSKSNF